MKFSYSRAAMVFHWLGAAMIIAAIAMGVYMTNLHISPLRLKLYNWHKWLGICILALSLARLGWRLLRSPPADLTMPAWQKKAAHMTHWTLYALFLAVPLAGWAYSSASGFPPVLFGVLPLPDLVEADRKLAVSLKSLHMMLALALGCVIALHVGAVIKHQFIDRDGLLWRMLPGDHRKTNP